MYNQKEVIGIVGSSEILNYGLSGIIKENSSEYIIVSFYDLESFQSYIRTNEVAIVFVDSGIISSDFKALNSLIKSRSETIWIALVYQYITPSVTEAFHYSVNIHSTSAEILSLIKQVSERSKDKQAPVKTEVLSEREIDVLKLLVTGFSGKEIADKLNISINTVISHRKNISNKTGIKSLAGLTIFAVANKIITMSNLQR